MVKKKFWEGLGSSRFCIGTMKRLRFYLMGSQSTRKRWTYIIQEQRSVSIGLIADKLSEITPPLLSLIRESTQRPTNTRQNAWNGDAYVIADTTKCLKLMPKYSKPYMLRGKAYAKIGKFREAVRDIKEAIRLKPIYTEVVNRLLEKIYQGRNDF